MVYGRRKMGGLNFYAIKSMMPVLMQLFMVLLFVFPLVMMVPLVYDLENGIIMRSTMIKFTSPILDRFHMHYLVEALDWKHLILRS
jgi:hypothetical protein